MAQRPATALPVSIIDDQAVKETFATSIIDVSLIGNGSISVTFGAIRNVRENFDADPTQLVCVNNRIVFTLDAAQSLAHLLARMLTRAKELAGEKQGGGGITQEERRPS